jgi:hypothetical protein
VAPFYGIQRHHLNKFDITFSRTDYAVNECTGALLRDLGVTSITPGNASRFKDTHMLDWYADDSGTRCDFVDVEGRAGKSLIMTSANLAALAKRIHPIDRCLESLFLP